MAETEHLLRHGGQTVIFVKIVMGILALSGAGLAWATIQTLTNVMSLQDKGQATKRHWQSLGILAGCTVAVLALLFLIGWLSGIKDIIND